MSEYHHQKPTIEGRRVVGSLFPTFCIRFRGPWNVGPTVGDFLEPKDETLSISQPFFKNWGDLQPWEYSENLERRMVVVVGVGMRFAWRIIPGFVSGYLAHLIGDRLIPEQPLWVDCGILDVTH